MIVGLYRAGNSVLHRMRAGVKLVALALFGTLLLSLPSLWLAASALFLVCLAYAVAGFGLHTLLAQIRPLLIVLAILFAAQIWLADLTAAGLSVARLAALVLAAGLVTLTTRTEDLVGAIHATLSPLERFGVDAGKVSLAISLTLRFIPLVSQVVDEVKEAQAARGSRKPVVTLIVPVIIRLLKSADAIAEAIDARS
ncbi:energy-coupling factor transporter transmembrane protein EcfT [Fulvimarina endophytica]|uniref:Energy-coupling factor transporter transmembrane protein EcfT n=1 Tax=Fulvimarina endophytica TaxID=2293836 RepID=A0A371X2C4_9HYPH|nr:energy-coupling factor transporter transmembrane protein EcfT [Fulvimarina endophytica]RFC63363.1 energy-coupling factor transporter transmembrane protein EcfT [Fulvimarina endophytica]